ncbi:MAG: methyltransferase domain-containing protein [Methanomicrobiaceae archaeon]|uniref:Gamma-tocopherol methyltransferase n=1 Tax=hydrocarbon metagenome TaxID=938273 RepID=A0A0W8FI84_9ZZZZ|nr:methyltransferase domain-containing protein [Methanomicrobiaceae archaeon]MDD5418552.1 methyltransferase domain-containing protein [Methanomicrobiaceae archaeon]
MTGSSGERSAEREIVRGKRLDVTIADVTGAYEGRIGALWEMLMGEQIHVGGEKETDFLAKLAGLNGNHHVLDVCCGLGGPARQLARIYGCRVTGLDATKRMVDEAVLRTERAGLGELVAFRLGNALDMPFQAGSFDLAWGQDAWCYVTDKARLVREAYRVVRPGGLIAFTDWIQAGTMADMEWTALNSFMIFPYMETIDGYVRVLEDTGFRVLMAEDLSEPFAGHCRLYQHKLRTELKGVITREYGAGLYRAAEEGLRGWVRAADERKVGRGRFIARKG